MATDIIARGMAANAKKSVTALGNKIESEKWIGTKAEWEAVDKSTIKDGTIVYITDDETVILYDKAEMEKIAAQVATDRKAAETAAQTAQSIADSLPDDYVTAVGKIAENTAEIANIKLTDKELKRRVDALFDMGQGITHQFETDSETAYAKTVPTGAKLMSVKSVGGRSIVWNQLVSQLEEATFEGVTGAKLNDKTLQISGTSTSVVSLRIIPVQTVIIGHKYIFHSHASDTAELFKFNGFYNRVSETDKRFYEYGKGIIFTNADNAIDMRLRLEADVTVNFQITPQLFDLTAMFGAGNEPSTVEEFEAMFPNDYYQYNAGEIVSAGTESVVEQGKNLLNADDYYAAYKQSDGSYLNNSSDFAGINIPIGNYIGKTLIATLKATVSSQPTSFFWLARINGTRIESSYAKGERVPANTTGIARLTFTPKTQKDTLSMTYGQGTGDVIVRDIQIELGDTPTTYAPFHRNVYQIPEAIKALPGYGWSAGTARNYVDYENKRYVQCVGSVDLGTLGWTYSNIFGTGQNGFSTDAQNDIYNMKSYPAATISNCVCTKYPAITASAQSTSGARGISIYNGWNLPTAVKVIVFDTAYTDAATFKQAMQGVILYYELANPIITDISSLIPDDFLRNVEVEAGGSVTFKNSNGGSYRIPVSSEEEYIVKLSEVGGTT